MFVVDSSVCLHRIVMVVIDGGACIVTIADGGCVVVTVANHGSCAAGVLVVLSSLTRSIPAYGLLSLPMLCYVYVVVCYSTECAYALSLSRADARLCRCNSTDQDTRNDTHTHTTATVRMGMITPHTYIPDHTNDGGADSCGPY